MSGFSQGKWFTDGLGIVRSYDEYEQRSIAKLIRDDDTKDIDDANERLILAAPEMYEAINECADTLQAIKDIDDCKDTAELYQVEDFVHYLWELVARIDGKEV